MRDRIQTVIMSNSHINSHVYIVTCQRGVVSNKPPWAPGSDKTWGQGTYGGASNLRSWTETPRDFNCAILRAPNQTKDYLSNSYLQNFLKETDRTFDPFLLRQGEPGSSQYSVIGCTYFFQFVVVWGPPGWVGRFSFQPDVVCLEKNIRRNGWHLSILDIIHFKVCSCWHRRHQILLMIIECRQKWLDYSRVNLS